MENKKVQLLSDGEIGLTNGYKKGYFSGAKVYRRIRDMGMTVTVGRYAEIMQAVLIGIERSSLSLLYEREVVGDCIHASIKFV